MSVSVETNLKSMHTTALDRYIKAVCNEMGYTVREVKGQSRKREVVDLRHLLMTIAYMEFNLTCTRVGDYFGHKNHATVLHAKDKIENLLKTNQIDLNLRQSLIAADQVMFNQWGIKLKTIQEWLTTKQ